MSKVTPLSNVRRFLEGVIARRSDVIISLARSQEDGKWAIGFAADTDRYPLEEMIGMVEVIKTHLIGYYFDEIAFTPMPKTSNPEGDSDG